MKAEPDTIVDVDQRIGDGAGAGAGATRADRVLRFLRTERLLHWAIAIPFLVCFLSAAVLVLIYNPNPLRPYREIVSWTHRIAGVCLIALPLLSLLLSRGWRIHLYNIKQAWRWTGADFKWLALMGLAAIFKRIRLPEQGKFNAAEKLNFMMVMTTYPLFIATGLLIWLPQVYSFLPWVVHFALALLAMPLMLGHIFMATINRSTRVGLPGMIGGYVDRQWAKHHYTRWYREQFGDTAVIQVASAPAAEPELARPALAEAAFDEPAFDEPAFDEPAFDEPAFDEPAFDEDGATVVTPRPVPAGLHDNVIDISGLLPLHAAPPSGLRSVPTNEMAQAMIEAALHRSTRDVDGALAMLQQLRDAYPPVLHVLYGILSRAGRQREAIEVGRQALLSCMRGGHWHRAAELFGALWPHLKGVVFDRDRLLAVAEELLRRGDLSSAARACAMLVYDDCRDVAAIDYLQQIARARLQRGANAEAAQIHRFLERHAEGESLGARSRAA